MIDYGRVSRIIDFCLSRLSTQSVIDAKAEAIKECIKPWFETYEARNLANPECHYEAILHKYAWPQYNAALDRVAKDHEDLIRTTPAVLFGKLTFIKQVDITSAPITDRIYYIGSNTRMWMEDDGIFFDIRIGDEYRNIYKLGTVELW